MKEKNSWVPEFYLLSHVLFKQFCFSKCTGTFVRKKITKKPGFFLNCVGLFFLFELKKMLKFPPFASTKKWLWCKARIVT